MCPAAAASGRAGGFLAADWCNDGPLGPLARAGCALHARLAETFGAGSIGYRPTETYGATFKTGVAAKASSPNIS